MKKPFGMGKSMHSFLKFRLKMRITFVYAMLSFIQINANPYNQSGKLSLDYDNGGLILNGVSGRAMIIEKRGASLLSDSLDFQFQLTGTVTDESGSPLPGANIVEKGTTNGVSADFDGNFSLNLPNGNANIVISYMGFISKEIPVNGRATINIQLLESAGSLDEVVLVGYGSQKRSNLTGATVSIKSEDISDFPLARVDQALQGKASGVYVLNTDSAPGGNTLIRIRGGNSINGGNEPLIVIDGFQGGDLNSLNPLDVESMEVLKDASATAIYGSRGANGVILVTTKRGQISKPMIDVGYSVGWQHLANKLPVLNAPDYARIANLIRSKNTANGNVPVPVFSDSEIEGFEANGGTDWQDEVYRTGVVHNAQLGLSGGTDGLKYRLSTNFLNNQGILENSSYQRSSIRANINAKINDKLNLGFVGNYIHENAKSADFGWEVSQSRQGIAAATLWAPTEPVYYPDGSYFIHRTGYGGGSGIANPVAAIVEPIHDNPISNTNAILDLNFKINEDLSLIVNGAGSLINAKQSSYQNLKTETGKQDNGRALVSNSTSSKFQNSNILTYDKTFEEKHHLMVTGLFEQYWEKFSGNDIIARDFLIDELGFDNLDGASTVNVSSEKRERTLRSWMYRINYIFDDKYLFTASLRSDASSVFGPDNKWGTFPSASIAWRISEEDFLNHNDSFNLKIRGSWGVTGNQGISPYQSFATLNSSLFYPYNGGTTTDIGFGLGGLANPKLKWEETTQTNFGMDLSLFKGRLTSTIDVYKKVTEDLLMPRELPGYVGVGSILDNVGSIQNTGIEVFIGGDPVVGTLNWNTSFNLTVNKNEVLDLGEDDKLTFEATRGGYDISKNFMVLEVGKPFGTMNGYVFEGIWRTDEDAEARSYGQLPGMQKFKDIDGDGDIDLDDRITIGKGFPDYTIGWTNRFNYRNWNLDFLVLAVQGVDLFNQLRIRRDAEGGTDPRVLNAWTPENQDTNIPGYPDGAYVQEQALVNKYSLDGSESTRYVEDASFIRLKTIQLGYSFDQNWLKRIGASRLKVYASGTNVFTITDYTGYDPEVASFGGDNDASVGVDLSSFPNSKMFTLGMELAF